MSILFKAGTGLAAGVVAGALGLAFFPRVEPTELQPRKAVEKPQFVAAPAAASATAAAPRAPTTLAIASEASPAPAKPAEPLKPAVKPGEVAAPVKPAAAKPVEAAAAPKPVPVKPTEVAAAPKPAPVAKPTDAAAPPKPAAATPEPGAAPVALASLDPQPAPLGQSRSISFAAAHTPAAAADTPASAAAPSAKAAAPAALPIASDASARWSVRGLVALAKGDLSTARLYLTRAAEAGDPRAWVALADTYDPAMLTRLGAVMTPGDAQRARDYLVKAAAAGVVGAKDRTAALEADAARNIR